MHESGYHVRVTYTKQRSFHVETHLIVVKGHNLNKALERAHLDGNRRSLGSLTNYLHDVVSFALNWVFSIYDKNRDKLKKDDVPPARSYPGRIRVNCTEHG